MFRDAAPGAVCAEALLNLVGKSRSCSSGASNNFVANPCTLLSLLFMLCATLKVRLPPFSSFSSLAGISMFSQSVVPITVQPLLAKLTRVPSFSYKLLFTYSAGKALTTCP